MNESIDHKDITARLKFIGRLSKGDKINVKNMFIQQQNSWLDKLSRSFYYVDDRTNTLAFLIHTLKISFELFETCVKSNDAFSQIQARNLFTDLRTAKKGLINLKDTYADDVMFVCKLDALIEENDAKLEEIRSKFFANEKNL
jgi:hypothetical protein